MNHRELGTGQGGLLLLHSLEKELLLLLAVPTAPVPCAAAVCYWPKAALVILVS